MDFSITGGELRIDKRVFVREMLKPNSMMRRLLNYRLEDGEKKRSLSIDKSSSQTVVISFNFVDKVTVGEDYSSLLARLKKEYRDKIKGRVTLSACYYHMMYVNISLDSDDGEVVQTF